MDLIQKAIDTHGYLTSTIVAGRRQLFWPVDGSCR